MRKKTRSLTLFVATVFLSVFPIGLIAQQISISFDQASADAILTAIGDPQLTREQAKTVAKLSGSQGMIRKTQRYQPAATEDTFVDSLVAVAHAGPLGNDPFQLSRTKKRLEATRALLQGVIDPKSTVMQSVSQRVAMYSPKSAEIRVRAVLVAGGTSDAWVLGDATEGVHDFYVALDVFQGDRQALEVELAHEIHHLVQASLADTD